MGSSNIYDKPKVICDKLMLIENLNLPDDINNTIKMKYKYKMLKNKYKGDMSWCIQHITYYDFLNKKLNRKYKSHHNLLKTIRTYDYLSPVAY